MLAVRNLLDSGNIELYLHDKSLLDRPPTTSTPVQIMAALVQTYSQETGTITMLQTRPTSATGRIPSGQQQPLPQFGNSTQAPRAAYHGNATFTGYRGSSTPVQQYAFQSTPSLNNITYRGSGSAAGVTQAGSRDDSVILNARHGVPVARPQPTHKAAPDRYRRGHVQPGNHTRSQSATLPSTANLPNTANYYNVANSSKAAMANRPANFYVSVPGTSMDDMHIYQQPQPDAKGMRRRSMQSLDSAPSLKPQLDPATKAIEADPKTSLRPVPNNTAHSRSGSSESVNSSRSNQSRPSVSHCPSLGFMWHCPISGVDLVSLTMLDSQSANRSAPVASNNPSSTQSDDMSSVAKQEQPKSVSIPPRGSSTDAAKRTLNPSPLSRPVTMANETADRPSSPAASGGNLDSPAAKQLAAINQKGGKAKSKTSRLRRAFSFGSAAEFRKAAGEGEVAEKNESSKLHKEPSSEEAYDAEQARIAEAQEAAGIGSSIYGGRFFGGSTDNLSISSTASSASIMIRKMGRGMKKSTRSLAGLFRPKSVVGIPPADPVSQEGSQAAVSMVTVEAETQRVNVNAEPQGSDNFPHLERNSLDANQVPEMGHERTGSSGTENSHSRKSIVGGDRERAEVLAAVRKGILKREYSKPAVLRLYAYSLQTLDHLAHLCALWTDPWISLAFRPSPTRPIRARRARPMTRHRDTDERDRWHLATRTTL